jgi:phosphoglycerate dehydrogenase-like enzyme
MEVVGWTRIARPGRAKHRLKLVSLEELISGSDVVSVHLVDNAQTERLVSAALLGRMKPSAYSVTTARAEINGAALDVHEEDPFPRTICFRSLPNVQITPHLGYNTREAGLNMLRIATAMLEAFRRGERRHGVNPA